ncbi:MAG: antitoxin [Acidobacteria bacterium]|nr:MAG: antitoxin [Acidobacteriota bacterium]
MASTALVIEVLGGKGVLGKWPADDASLIELVRAGLPYRAFECVLETLGINREEAARPLALPLRTLARRKQERRFHADESDRLLRLAHAAARALEVFEDKQKAQHWMRKPNRALGGCAPLELLDTEIGARQVEQVLCRIEHGVYS